MPSMPWPCGAPPPSFSCFGASAIIASVVSKRPATDVAFCSANRVTFVGSMMPNFTMSPYSPVCGVEAVVALAVDDGVEHHGRVRAGVSDDLTQRLFDGFAQDVDADVLVVVRALEVRDTLERA